MKIVIEIPDHVYEHAKKMSEDSNDEYEAMRAIAKGQEYRPRGEWIPLKNKKGEIVAFRCSSCGQSPKYAVNSDFCPKCGAVLI